MSTLEISWQSLENMLAAMTKVGDQAAQVNAYVDEYVCDPTGFDYPACALKPIADQIGRLGGLFDDLERVFQEHWRGTTEAVLASARAVDRTDDTVSIDFGRLLGGGNPMVRGSDRVRHRAFEVHAFDVDDLTDRLAPPGQGADTLHHDPDWNVVSEGYDDCRDTINSGIDRINGLGVPGVNLPRLSEKSLEEFIVYPLSGHYLKIQGNAEACDHTGDAMRHWGTNFSKLSLDVVFALKGEVSAALVTHLQVYDLVMRGVGTCVDAGSVVFTEIARVSEEIAVEVEKALVLMGKTLLRVSSRIATRVLGWLGWAMLAEDVVRHGMSAITDIYDDVMACIHIIEACFDLVEAIRAWAEEAAARLRAFERLADLVRSLPGVAAGQGLGALPPVHLGPIRTSLAAIDDDTSDDGPGRDGLDGALSGLGQQAEDETSGLAQGAGGDEPDVPEGQQLLAPGEPGSSSSPVMSA